MKYFDSHAHYYDERFSDECEKSADELIGALLKTDVSYIINVGTSPKTSREAIIQAKRHKSMYTAIGVHPTDASSLTAGLDDTLAEIEGLILDKENKCVAIGEIGLDYHYPDTNKELQQRYFEAQLLLAERLNLPVVIHDRDAHGDIMEILRAHRGVRGVLHSFSGSPEMARELCKMGFYISFSGTVTFTNARKVREAAGAVSIDRVLIETDCPYLAPHPHRGTLNHSGNLVYTNHALAEVFGISDEEMAKITEENAKALFNIKDTDRI